MPALPPVDLVVLAGGRGTRMGGRDKASIELGGRTLLERVLTADLGGRVVVVGETAVPDGVRRTVEDPPGGGPVAGIGAGLDALPWSQRSPSAAGDPSRPDWVAVCAVDQPGAPQVLAALRHTLAGLGEEIDAVCPRHDGRAQWLLAVYRRAALDAARARRARVAETGASVRSLVAPLRWRELEFDGVHLGDVDTPADLERWSSALGG